MIRAGFAEEWPYEFLRRQWWRWLGQPTWRFRRSGRRQWRLLSSSNRISRLLFFLYPPHITPALCAQLVTKKKTQTSLDVISKNGIEGFNRFESRLRHSAFSWQRTSLYNSSRIFAIAMINPALRKKMQYSCNPTCCCPLYRVIPNRSIYI